MLKNTINCLLAFLAIGLALSAQATDQRSVNELLAAQDPIHVTIHGEAVEFDVPPVIVNGRTFVEVNGLFQRLEIDLAWNGQLRRVTGTSTINGNVIELDLGSTQARVNGSPVTLDAAPFIATEYSRTMVPLAFVAEHAANNVTWVQESRTAVVRKNNLPAQDNYILSAWQMAHHTYQGYSQYGHPGPISITPGTLGTSNGMQSIYMVSLSGTDMERAQGQATGWWTNIIIGFYDAENDYLTAVRNRISWHIPTGSNLILSGHSQGGMVAQQVAGDPWVRQNYNVLHTVTFGSPKTGGNHREGVIRRLGDWIDPVPYASFVEGTLTSNPLNIYGLNREWSGIGNPINAHNQSYLRQDVWGAYDAVGTKYGDSIVVLDGGMTNFYPAPDL